MDAVNRRTFLGRAGATVAAAQLPFPAIAQARPIPVGAVLEFSGGEGEQPIGGAAPTAGYVKERTTDYVVSLPLTDQLKASLALDNPLADSASRDITIASEDHGPLVVAIDPISGVALP